jgi:hypothetical protein
MNDDYLCIIIKFLSEIMIIIKNKSISIIFYAFNESISTSDFS